MAVVGISANDVTTHPDDSPKMMAREKAEVGYTFPYLYDETQQVALAYKAACTPDFYVFDKDQKLVYRGQLDGSRPGNRSRSRARSAGSPRRRARRQARERRPAAQHRLQHQVEARQRAELRLSGDSTFMLRTSCPAMCRRSSAPVSRSTSRAFPRAAQRVESVVGAQNALRASMAAWR